MCSVGAGVLWGMGSPRRLRLSSRLDEMLTMTLKMITSDSIRCQVISSTLEIQVSFQKADL
jgi:hypothetical protein